MVLMGFQLIAINMHQLLLMDSWGAINGNYWEQLLLMALILLMAINGDWGLLIAINSY